MDTQPKPLKGKRIAVVGGGFTGLTAAWKIQQHGGEAVVFEANSVIGGLASGCTLLDVPVEKAYHFLYKTDAHMLGVLKELGLDEKLEFHKSSVATYYDGRLYPMESPLDLIKFTPLTFLNRIRAGLAVLYLQNVRNWEKLTKISALDWLTRYSGKQVTDVIWAPLLRGKFDRYYDKVTMCWLWGRIKQRVESRDKKLGGEALGYIEGGFVTLVDKLEAEIKGSGGTILTDSPISGIQSEKNADGELKHMVSTGNATEEFDSVLLTVPCSVAHRLLREQHEQKSPEYFEKLKSIDYLDAAVLLFATDKPISPYYWHNINTPNSPFVVFLSLTSLIGTQQFNGKHVYYIGDYIPREHEYMSQDPDALKSHWFDALGKMFPEFDEKSVLEHQVFRFRDAQHIVDVGFENKIVDYRTPAEGVYLCNFSQIFPMDRGTNYAVRDGIAMAEMIAKDIGE